MRSTVALLLVVGAGASQTSAATVSFDPPVVVVSPGEAAEFLVSITSTDFPSFSAVDMGFLHQDGLPLEWPENSFAYDQSFYNDLDIPPPPGDLQCKWTPTCPLAVGGFNSRLWTVTEDVPLIIGTLSVNTTSLASGSHEIRVAPSYSAITSHGGWEPISGSATVIVPEPGMASLICVTAMCLVRRRHRKRCKSLCREV